MSIEKDNAANYEKSQNGLNQDPAAVTRRDFVRSISIAAGVGAAGVALATQTASEALAAPKKSNPGNGGNPPGKNNQRANEAYGRRVDAAKEQRKLPDPILNATKDETKLANYIGSFSKTLPHDEFGEVDPVAYGKLLIALASGELEDFDAIPAGGQGRLANPRAAYSFALAGADSHKIDMPAVHAFNSKRQAAEAGEVYWMALARDVPFAQYNTSSITQAAAADMSAFSDFTGPKNGGNVTTQTLFRGLTPGDLVGPYISQFLLMDIPYGNQVIPQVARNPVVGDDYMADYASWLAVQRGQFPGIGNTLEGTARPIETARDLGEYVHKDFTYQAFLNAALICLGFGGAALDPNEYSIAAREGGFVTFGPAAILDLVARAARISLRPAWFHKWLVHRKLRPEAFGGRVHNLIASGRDYPIHDEFLDSQALPTIFALNGNYLLPQAFPEGSPTHPSYPAGHATIAGACVTVLKAFFYEGFVIPGSGGLTLGGELNKLASNIALGRNFAGVHWRADGDEGLRAGEAIAITFLQDELRMVTEQSILGFSLTTFDGDDILIVP